MNKKEELWAITTYFNPENYKSRINNYNLFRKSLKKQGVKLLCVELSFSDSFTLNKDSADKIIQVKSKSVLWQKERLLNVALENLPSECKYVAWLDADIIFPDDGWADKAKELLEKNEVIHLFKDLIELPKQVYSLNEALELRKLQNVTHHSFIYESYKGIKGSRFICGFGWAAQKDFISEYGFFDKAPLFFGDTIMTYAFLQKGPYSYNINEKLHEDIKVWHSKINENPINVSYLSGEIIHLFHGSYNNRGYTPEFSKNNLIDYTLIQNDFDPKTDLKINEYGAWEWASDKPELHKSIKEYFGKRKEDMDIK